MKEWAPPVGRDLPPVLYTDASGGEAFRGGAFPSLPPSPILTMEDHVNFAAILNQIMDLVGVSAPKSSRGGVGRGGVGRGWWWVGGVMGRVDGGD